jgi:hypothetical protein
VLFRSGLVLLLATILLGDSDLDTDTDVDLDPDIDFDAEVDFSIDGAGELDALNTVEARQGELARKKLYLPFLSIRFWTYGLAVFGVTGFVLQKTGQVTAVHSSLAVLMGVGVGWVAALIFHKFKNTTVDSSSNVDYLRGTEGVVVLTIRPKSVGKVRLNLKEQDVEVHATTRQDQALDIGARVLIVESTQGQVEVVPFPEVAKE